jgi:hypothetical protein
LKPVRAGRPTVNFNTTFSDSRSHRFTSDSKPGLFDLDRRCKTKPEHVLLTIPFLPAFSASLLLLLLLSLLLRAWISNLIYGSLDGTAESELRVVWVQALGGSASVVNRSASYFPTRSDAEVGKVARFLTIGANRPRSSASLRSRRSLQGFFGTNAYEATFQTKASLDRFWRERGVVSDTHKIGLDVLEIVIWSVEKEDLQELVVVDRAHVDDFGM